MSLLDWLKPRSQSSNPIVPTGATAMEARHQLPPSRPPVADTDLKARRQERRERLYSVVREAMLRSEVLASRYKFKVLSLDTHGRQFLIMVDLLDASAVSPSRFASIEQLIITHAAHHYGIYVKSVYWRSTESLTASAHAAPVSAAVSKPGPVATVAIEPAPPVAPTPLTAKPEATLIAPAPEVPKPVKKPGFDPIDQAEVLAFKKAIGAIPSTPVDKNSDQVHASGPRHVMTGFEDTMILDTTDEGGSPLSRTQFGELL